MTDAERAVLGAILISPAALDDVADLLTPADMADSRHEVILGAAFDLARRGTRVDPITVGDHLGTRALHHVGGATYLQQLIADNPISTNASHHARLVRKDAIRRRLTGLSMWLQQQIEDGVDPAAVQSEARTLLDKIDGGDDDALRPLSQTILQTLDDLDSEGEPFTPTGWVDLDKLIHGWRPGGLHVCAARPGGGKSIMGLQAALSTSRRGKGVLIASMEMGVDELNLRVLAQSAQVGMDNLSRRTLSEMEWQKISTAVGDLTTLPVYVDEKPTQHVARIRAQARKVARTADLGMIVVDYLQQVQPPAHLLRAPRHEQVADTARSLKNLARELNVPILALAQLNRQSEQRADRRPTLADLRESGAIEADADVVMLLHREGPDDPNLSCAVAKSRHGRMGAFSLAWQANFARVMSHTDPYGRQAS